MPSAHYCPRCLTTFAERPPRCPNLGCQASAPEAGWPTLLGAGDVLDRTYHIVERIAGGAAGMTYLARELDHDDAQIGPELAIKVLYQQRDSGPFLRRLATEAQILQELAHPHIVECLGFVHRAGRPPYLVTRFEAGGTLQGHLANAGPLHPAVAAAIGLQILDALEVAHRADIVHRDLKPGNILLREQVPAHEVPTVLLADFGVARITGSLGGMTRIGTFVGTPEYAAPEQFLGLEPTGATDLFAVGAVLWACVTGEPPFRFSHRHDPATCHDELVALLPPPLPPALRDSRPGGALQPVLDGLLLPQPEHRWTIPQARDALRDVIQRTRGDQLRAPAPSSTGREPTSNFEDPHGTFLWEEDDASPNLGSGGTLFAEPAPAEPAAQPRQRARSASGNNEPSPKAVADTPSPARARRPAAAIPAAPSPMSSMEGLFDFSPGPVPDEPAEHEPAPARTSHPDPDPSVDPIFAEAPPDRPSRAARGSASIFDPDLPIAASMPASALAAPDGSASVAPEPAAPPPVDVAPEPPDAPEDDPFEAFFDDAPSPRALFAALGDDDRPATLARARALDARTLADGLRAARSDEDPRVRRGAAIAAGQLGLLDQTALLRALLRDPVAAVRAAAAAALGQIGQGSVLPHLSRVLDDREPEVRAAAALAVARAYARDGDLRRGREQLARLGTDRDPTVRDAFASALALLDRYGM